MCYNPPMDAQPAEREAFVEWVRQALGQIHSPSLLQSHPLRSFLGRDGPAPSVEELQQALLDAIRRLRPAQAVTHATPQWRRYRYLWLRYVEGVGLEEVAATLGVTDRQARRDHREGLEEVAATVWARYQSVPWVREPRDEAEDSRPSSPISEEGEAGAALEAELAKLASEQPRGPTSLAEALDGALETVSRLVRGLGLRLEVSAQPDLPPVSVNRIILRQMLLSIFAHVLRRQGGESLELVAAVDSGAVTLVVAVAGGRAPQDSALLAGGTEAPLELARRMARGEGVSLTADEEPGRGERIVLRLPAAHVPTLLVVDDNLDFLRLCQRYLEGSGTRVLVSSLASEALRVARTSQPDVVIIDVLMPSQDGWDLLSTLQRDDLTRDIPVVVCSVLREPSLALGLGAAGFLPKPITRLSLLSAVEQAGLRRQARPDSPGDIRSDPLPRVPRPE